VAYIDANYRSISAILADLLSQFTALIRKEGQLARAEMSEKMREIALSFAFLVGGSVLLIPALVILLQAGMAALVVAGLAVGWASLAVGGVVLLIGLVLVAVGISRLKAQSLVPSKTIEQLQRDAALASHEIRNDHGTAERAA
jgi:hypothetical protein